MEQRGEIKNNLILLSNEQLLLCELATVADWAETLKCLAQPIDVSVLSIPEHEDRVAHQRVSSH
jgi:hypothetical protein